MNPLDLLSSCPRNICPVVSQISNLVFLINHQYDNRHLTSDIWHIWLIRSVFQEVNIKLLWLYEIILTSYETSEVCLFPKYRKTQVMWGEEWFQYKWLVMSEAHSEPTRISKMELLTVNYFCKKLQSTGLIFDYERNLCYYLTSLPLDWVDVSLLISLFAFSQN